MPSERSARIISQAARRAAGIEARRRLVEEDELGVADERDAEVEPALLAAGERLHARVALLAEPDELDHLVDVARVRVVAGEQLVRLADREVRATAPTLEDDADALPQLSRPASLGIVPEHARPRRRRASGSPRGSRPSSSCRRRSGPSSPNTSPCRDVEADPADRLDAAVGLREVADDDCARHDDETICTRE